MKLIVGVGNIGKEFENTRHNVGWLVLDKLKQEISKSEFLCRRQENLFDISKQIPISNFKYTNNKKLQSLVLSLACRQTGFQSSVVLAKPMTMMNNSGEAVAKLANFYKVIPADIWVIHDDLDILLGQYKIQFGKGPKVHNGLLSIYERLKTKDFWHVRVGIENRIMNSESRIKEEPPFATHFAKATKIKKATGGKDYVLQDFEESETEVRDRAIGEVVEKLIKIVE